MQCQEMTCEVENQVNKPGTIAFFELNSITTLAMSLFFFLLFFLPSTVASRDNAVENEVRIRTARIDSLIISLYGGCSGAAEAFLAAEGLATADLGAISNYLGGGLFYLADKQSYNKIVWYAKRSSEEKFGGCRKCGRKL